VERLRVSTTQVVSSFLPVFFCFKSRWRRDFPPVQTGPGAHPASCTMGTWSFPGVKCDRGVLLTTYPLLAPKSLKSRAIPLPPLWATTGPVTGLLYLYLFIYFCLGNQNLHASMCLSSALPLLVFWLHVRQIQAQTEFQQFPLSGGELGHAESRSWVRGQVAAITS